MIAKLPNATEPLAESAVRSFLPSVRPPVDAVLETLSTADRDLLFQIMTLPAEYVEHPDFVRKSIENRLYGSPCRLASPTATRFRPAVPVRTGRPGRPASLTGEQEQLLFQRLNYARYRVFEILRRHQGKVLSAAQTRLLLAWSRRVLDCRAEIIQVNLPLVLAMAKRTRLGGVDFGELVSEGNMALLRSVDKFNCARGFKFSTYACRAILKSFSRAASRAGRYRGMFPTEFDPTLEKGDLLEQQHSRAEEDCVSDLREILRRNLAQLSDVEQTVIRERFALGAAAEPVPPPKTLEQVGLLIGVTKERVRQIQNKALRKIRHALEESFLAA